MNAIRDGMIRGDKRMTAGANRPSGPTVGAGFARGLFELAVSKGADRATLLARADLTESDFADQDGRVPMQSYVALMRAGIALSGDPALALHYGEINISEVSVVGLIGRASETMLDALVQLNRYVRLIVEADSGGAPDRFQIVQRDGEDWFVDTRINANAFPELTESAFAQLICGTREFAHESNRPYVRAVHVTHKRPGHWQEYERVFRAPVLFESDRNAMLIDKAWHDYRVARDTPYVQRILQSHADSLLAELDASRSWSGRVEGTLAPLLHTGDVSLDAVAKKLGLGRQTLYRRLKDENTTFETILDTMRRRMAEHYLGERRLSVNETSYLVGFSDPAAFSRAYKRWTGRSPGADKAR
jgi:AraC-like DNA-binding protein